MAADVFCQGGEEKGSLLYFARSLKFFCKYYVPEPLLFLFIRFDCEPFYKVLARLYGNLTNLRSLALFRNFHCLP